MLWKSLVMMCSVFAVSFALVGCANTNGDAENGNGENGGEASGDNGSDEHEGHDHNGNGEAAADVDLSPYADELDQLSPADRQLAHKQKICPVTEEPLGSMGVPPKVTVNGRDVLLCCAGCEGAIKEDPEKYLAKLPD